MGNQAQYARGSQAWGICQRCGFRALLNTLIFDGRYAWLRVHPECWEDKHPQERMTKVYDPVALFRPSPEDNNLVAPVLSATLDGPDVLLAWTPASTQGARFEGYLVYQGPRAAPTQLAGLPISYDMFAGKLSEPLAYTVAAPDAGSSFWVSAYDCYQRAVSSNLFTVGA